VNGAIADLDDRWFVRAGEGGNPVVARACGRLVGARNRPALRIHGAR
jgi:hypothetical protein